MTNSLALTKKALTIAVAAATILWTVGLTAFVPVEAQAASFGDLIKGQTLSTVYYYGSDGQRYSFPNEKTFFTWYEDFSSVVTISDEELADITLAGNIVYRPGSRWIKITSDEKVYATSTDGSVHWIENEATAVGLAGSNWNTFVDDVPDVFFVDYTVGDSLTDASSGYEGMLWTNGTSNYLVWGGVLRAVTSAGMTSNRFQSGFVQSGTGFSTSGLSSGGDVSSELASLTDTAQMVATDTYVAGGEITVAASSDNPSASTFIAGQGIADILHITFTNPTSASVNVNGVSLRRTGVSGDTTISNVYLFDGYKRLTDAATVSSGVVSFNDSTGLITVPANSSAKVSVRSHIAASTGGQTLGLKLESANSVTLSGSNTATGSFPVSSATHEIASVPSTFATVSFATTTTPSASNIDAAEDLNLWQNSVTVGNNEVYLKALRFRNIGSINASDVNNWELYVAGVKRGATVTQQDGDGYFWFDLSADPLKINTGTHVFKVLSDVIGGTTRTVTATLRDTGDAIFVDEDYSQPVLVQANSTTFSSRSAGAQTVNGGTLTITKKSSSPSGNVVNTASSQSLAKFELKAFGEKMKVENLRVRVENSGNETAFTLRNGAVYADGAQVGSTAALAGDTDSTLAYTEYSFGSALIVTPGTTVELEVKADIFDSDGDNDLAAAETLQIEVAVGSSNVYRMSTGDYSNGPGTAVEANTVTVAAGSLTLAKNGSYADQTAVAPKTAYKVGSWTINASTTEDVAINSIDVDFDADDDADAALATADYTNLYITYGPTGTETTSTVKGTVATANSWSINYTLAKGNTIYVNAYANVATSVTNGDGTADTIKAELDVSGTTAASATTTSSSDVEGQTVTWSTGSFTPALDGASPVATAVAANQEIEAARYRFTASNETYTIKEARVFVGSAAAAGVINSVKLYDGATLLGSAVFSLTETVAGDAALVTGMSLEVPANSYKVITAKLLLNNIGSGAAAFSQTVALTLDTTLYMDSQGVETTSDTDAAGNEVRAYRSLPTVTHVDLTNSTLVNGQATDLYKFTVTANSNGSIALKQLNFTTSWTDGGATTPADELSIESFKLFKNGSDITDSVVLADASGVDAEDTGTSFGEADADLNITWSTEEVIGAGETVTYVVRGTPQGFNVTDLSANSNTNYFSLYLTGDSTHTSSGGTAGLSDSCLEASGTGSIFNLDDAAAVGSTCAAAATNATAANFIWSDNSSSTHSTAADGSSDWTNGYNVKNLDLSGETWSH